MGKPKSNGWAYFRPKRNQRGEIEGYACIFCNSMYQKNATRKKKHLKSFFKCPSAVKSLFKVETRAPCEKFSRTGINGKVSFMNTLKYFIRFCSLLNILLQTFLLFNYNLLQDSILLCME